MTCRLIVVILLIVPFIHCQKLITILSDFTNDKDVKFFKTTLPWIVENVGSDISLKFHFKDSGTNSGPRQCNLLQLTKNTYLQADYLSCLAKSNTQEECVKDLPIKSYQFKRCLRTNVKNFVINAEREFRKIKIDATPIIILPRRRVLTDTLPQNILQSICSLYPKISRQPIGCIMTSPFPDEKEKPDENIETDDSVKETTVSPEKKQTTQQEENSEGDTEPKEEKHPKENSTPKSETNLEEKKQPGDNSTSENETNPEEETQPNDNTAPPEVETKPKELNTT
ncbi:unnamed protein product [Euphydryas editha]|uniref:Uncharacterized protein n=1 Tax=Euphydryas editha TaxID=104508 RepID=A0AAU9UBM6_EUPED|nr:unnamed protein product [Euphydryas editha]